MMNTRVEMNEENKTMMNARVEMNDEMMAQVNGGSIWKEIKGAAKSIAKSLDEWLETL